MIFSEVYGTYFRTVSAILAKAVEGTLTRDTLTRTVVENAFGESLVTIPAKLTDGSWPLLTGDFGTPLHAAPHTPLTTLEKQWLKALLLDPRVRLFSPSEAGLEDVEPLFTPEQFVYFDRYADGDDFTDPRYIGHFRTILQALREKRRLRVRFRGRRGNRQSYVCIPYRLEYSSKDDKFRLMTSGTRHEVTVNLGRIVYCRRLNGDFPNHGGRKRSTDRSVTLIVTDKRNALERVLLHFSHFEKEAERIDAEHYKLTVNYHRDDETELVIRILSFGPLVKVIEPYNFVELIKQRLVMQRSCGL